jgi:hypothetical protein
VRILWHGLLVVNGRNGGAGRVRINWSGPLAARGRWPLPAPFAVPALCCATVSTPGIVCNFRRPEELLNCGAWQEWAAHEIDIAVPLSPDDIEQKRAAIFCHESQKDRALFPGPDDPREFWQRAEQRNRNTADVYNSLGLPEYFAIEGFVRWTGVLI